MTLNGNFNGLGMDKKWAKSSDEKNLNVVLRRADMERIVLEINKNGRYALRVLMGLDFVLR